MRTFRLLLAREFKLFWNNKVLLILFLGAPVLYAVLLGMVYGKGKVTDLPIVVVDQDQSSLSHKVIDMMQDHEVLSVVQVRFDMNNLQDMVIAEKAAAVVIIPPDFESDVLTKQYPELTTIINTANALTANYASTALQMVLGTLKVGMQIETLRKQGVPEAMLMSQYEPFKTSIIKKNNRATNYMYFLWPGILATVFQQVLLMAMAISFAQEFESGSMRKLVSHTRNTFVMMLVKVLPYMLMSIGVWVACWLYAGWLKMPLQGKFIQMSLVTGVFVLSVSFVGILVSIVLPNQLKATEVLMVVATPSFILSGFTWPLSQMPEIVQYVAAGIPLTHYLQAFRILMVEQGPAHLTYPYVINMLIIAAITFSLAWLILEFKVRRMKNLRPGQNLRKYIATKRKSAE